MRKIFFTVFISVFMFVAINAQTSEQISQLTPVAPNIGKFTKKIPKNDSYFDPSNLEFEPKVEVINLPEGKKGVAVIIQTHYKEVVFESIGGKYIARLNVYGRIISRDKTIDGFFEERLSETGDIDDLVNGANKHVALRKVFELPEGKFQIGIIVKDIASGNRGIKVIKFQIP